MKLIAGVAAVALGTAIALFFQNRDLGDRIELLEQRIASIDQSSTSSPPASPTPSPQKKDTSIWDRSGTDRKLPALHTCLSQLHAQVVTWWNDDKLPPDSRYCKKHFYGLGPRVGD